MIFGVEKQTPRRLAGIGLAVAGALRRSISRPRRRSAEGRFAGQRSAYYKLRGLRRISRFAAPPAARAAPLTIIAWTLLFGGIIIVALGASGDGESRFCGAAARGCSGRYLYRGIPNYFCLRAHFLGNSKSSPSTAAAFNTLQPIVSSVLAALF
jgi:hypothetical protein